MPSKKKPRLLFEVPAETGPGTQSGWVYRSEPALPETPRPQTDQPEPGAIPADEPSVFSMSTAVVALSMAAIAHAFALSVTVATIPWTMTLRTLGSLAKVRR